MNRKNKLQSKKKRERWYYDACALDERKEAFGYMINKRNIDHIVSHLALGEAYGNCCIKGTEQTEAFVNLITRLLKEQILIVGNDADKEVFKDVLNTFHRLDITDALHFTTAICEHCNVLLTNDGDLYGLNKSESKDMLDQFSAQRNGGVKVRIVKP